MKKVVLCVTNNLLFDQRLHRTAMTLLENNYSVKLIGIMSGNETGFPSRPYTLERLNLFFKRGPLFYAEYNIRLFIHLLKEDAEIFQANDLDTLPAVFIAAKLRGKQIIYDSHEFFTEMNTLHNRPVVRFIWLFLERIFFPRLAFVITVSDSIASAYRKRYKKEITVVRNLPQEKDDLPVSGSVLNKYKIPQNGKIIIYQGTLNKGRGILEMLSVLPKDDRITFLIAGGGILEKKIASQIRALRLEKRVILSGVLPFEDLHSLTSCCDGGLCLLENLGLSYYFSLPNRLFDYIQAELPFVYSPFPEVEKICSEFKIGLSLPCLDPGLLSDAINKLLWDPGFRAEQKSNLRSAKKILNWNNEKNNLINLYNRVI